MRFKLKLLLPFFAVIVSFCAWSQESFINENWNLINGLIGQELKIASKLNPDGELVYLSNHIQGSSASDIYLSCVDQDGNVVWNVTCPSTQGFEDYGTALEIDANGNIYVCAAKNNYSNLDFWIGKYSENGVLLWEQSYTGSGNGDDIPLAITLDQNNNPVVAGYVWNGITANDMAVMKLSTVDGSIIWNNEHIANLEQQAYSVQIDNFGDVIIGGVSSDSLIYGGVHLVKFDGNLGGELSANTVYSSQTGIDVLRKILVSQSGDIIVAGASSINTTNSDIMVMSFNSNLQLNWSTYKDRDTASDEVLDFTLNSNNEIICTGYTTKSSGGQELWISKINPSNGSIAWEFEKTARIDIDYVRGKSITTDGDNDIYVTGIELIDGQEKFITISVNNDGKFNWIKYFTNSDQSQDFAEKIQIDEFGRVYVTGVSIENNETAISTVNYTIDKQNITFVVDSNGQPTRIKGQVIVEFSPESILANAYNDRRLKSGHLHKFINNQMLNELQGVTGLDWSRFRAQKVLSRLTMDDTLSITRLGDTIRMSDMWTSLVINLPEEIDELNIANNITDLIGIHFACTNDIAVPLSPNDSLYVYDNQLSLHPNNIYPNADANIVEAWDNGFVGRDYVKVGVYDNVIDWSHQEFGSTGLFQNSVVTGGYDFQLNSGIELQLTNSSTHGTKVAGIIGAFRNNSMGIAGIAGGNLANLEKGVQLFSMGISFNDANFATIATISEAIYEGALQSAHPDSSGYGLHIQNHSWGTGTPNLLLRQAVKDCFRNHCVLIAAIGNEDNSEPNYPASFADRQVLNVIASGTDGERKKPWTNGYGAWGSSYGWDGSQQYPLVEPDFMAPGTRDMVTTLTAHWDTSSVTSPNCNTTASPYRCFEGTSASAPHVTGVAGLMYSEHVQINGYPNLLSTEDIEEILQKSATDKDVAGYDYQSGYGLINAGEALRLTSDPYYVIHKTHDNTDWSSNWLSNGTDVPQYIGNSQNGPISVSHDQVDTYRFTWIIQDTLPAGHVVVDAWNLEAGWKTGFNLNPNPVVTINLPQYAGQATVNLNVIPGATMVTGYAHTDLYLLTDEDAQGNVVGQSWYPLSPDELEFTYSIHVNSEPLAAIPENDKGILKLYPNPNNGNFTIAFDLGSEGEAEIIITDALGKLVKDMNLKGLDNGANKVDLELYGLQRGIYYCTLRTNNGVETIPFIKSN